jgi:hypothetical protein
MPGPKIIRAFFLVQNDLAPIVIVPTTFARHMRHGLLVSAAKGLLVIPSHFARHIRMTILIAVVDVWPAVIVNILSRTFNSIVKTPALNVVELSWRSFPVVPVSILTIPRRRFGDGICSGRYQTTCSQ